MITLLTSCSFLFNECNCQGPAEKDWWLKRNFLSYSMANKGKNTINKRLETPDRSSVVPKEQTKLVLIKQAPRARGRHQEEGGGAVMATKLFFHICIFRGEYEGGKGRRKTKDSIEESNDKEGRLISHHLSPFCLCLHPRQRQITLTLCVCILEQSSVMNAG